MFRDDYENYMSYERLSNEVQGHQARFLKTLDFCGEQPGTVLDVGAGTGHFAKMFQQRHPNNTIELCDIKPDYVMRLREQGFRAMTADIRNLPYPDRSFDTVVCTEVLEHLSNPGTGLKECFRLAKKQVIMSIPVKTPDDWHAWLISFEHVGNWLVLRWEREACND